MSPSPGQQEIFSLTSLRGIASLWVVIYHFWNDIILLFPSAQIFSPLVRRGSYAVPLFFILSGYVLSLKYFSQFYKPQRKLYLNFVARRLLRIYPVHLFTLIVVVAMVLVSKYKGWKLTDSGYGLDTFIQNIFLVHTWVPRFSLNWNYPSWSISSEWFAYLCFPLWCFLIERLLTSYRSKVFALITLIIMAGIIYSYPDIPFKELILVIPTFISGMIIWKLKSQKSLIEFKYIPDLILGLVITLLFISPDSFLAPVLLLFFSLLIYFLGSLENSCSNLWKHRYLIYLGQISYSLYMSHTLGQKVLYKILPVSLYIDADILIKIGLCLVYTAVVIVTCLLTYYGIEQPARIFFQRQIKKS